jgi:hypothetical protein
VVLPLLLALTAAAGTTAAPRGPTLTPRPTTVEADTLRPRAGARIARHRRTSIAMGSAVRGYLSSRGLPPQAGEFAVTDTGLVFRADDGSSEAFPLVGPLRTLGGRRWRASTISLAYLDESEGRTVYVFRLDAGVFQTETPGALLEVIDRPAWMDSVASREWGADRPLVAGGAAAAAVNGRITSGAYADTLYALFGRPARPIGQVGIRGRKAGRLGEYLAPRDSLALDPTRMSSEAQLRHTLAHELGHRWQARAPGPLATLWRGIPAIRDARRYGHDNTAEHQAEAIAFAVHYLQTTAGGRGAEDSERLLEQYDRMVPGTGVMVRYLALQPIYAAHPLRVALTTGRRG